MKKSIFIAAVCLLITAGVKAQKVDQDRMNRDLKVAENVLETLFKQESNRSIFFFNDIEGSYVPGYGAIFAVPNSSWHFMSPMPGAFVWSSGENSFNYFNSDSNFQINGVIVDRDDDNSTESDSDADDDSDREVIRAKKDHHDITRVKPVDSRRQQEEQARMQQEMAQDHERMARRQAEIAAEQTHMRFGNMNLSDTGPDDAQFTIKTTAQADSLRKATETRLLETMKTFLADYGDLLSQVPDNEKIMVTNRPSGFNKWDAGHGDLISAEVKHSDLTQFRQGKLTREQLMARIVTVNATASDEVKPDLELFASMLNRLYQPDLSSTYFIDDDVYYEQLNNFGVIYYMTVYSANRLNRDGMFAMPTQKTGPVSESDRNKKVTDLYPQFEQGLRENMLEYGRTIKSLGDNDMLMLKVKLTRCDKCGIPSTLELSVKGSVLKDFNSGKISLSDAGGKITEKKGEAQ